MTVAEQIEAERGLGDNLNDYAGQWVAVRDFEVIASGDTLEGLLGQIGQEQAEGQEEPVVFKVADDQAVACFY